jgi:hypothetical protein
VARDSHPVSGPQAEGIRSFDEIVLLAQNRP